MSISTRLARSARQARDEDGTAVKPDASKATFDAVLSATLHAGERGVWVRRDLHSGAVR